MRSVGAVLPSMLQPLSTRSEIVSAGSNSCARSVAVGMTRKSTSRNASSYDAVNAGRRFWARAYSEPN